MCTEIRLPAVVVVELHVLLIHSMLKICILCSGSARSSEQCLPPDIQHGAEPAESRGDQSRVHVGEVFLPVPELLCHPATH